MLFARSWTLEHFEFTRFIRALNSLHNRREFASWEGLLPGSSSLVAKCIPVFVKVRSSIVQLRVPTYNHDYFVLHCCFGFSASTCNDVTARTSSWLVNAARIVRVEKSELWQIFRRVNQSGACSSSDVITSGGRKSIHAIRTASFAWIAPQDCLSRLCIDLTCKSFARNVWFAFVYIIKQWCNISAVILIKYLIMMWNIVVLPCLKHIQLINYS